MLEPAAPLLLLGTYASGHKETAGVDEICRKSTRHFAQWQDLKPKCRSPWKAGQRYELWVLYLLNRPSDRYSGK